MSDKIVDDFLKEVKEQKVKQLLGITLDKRYWTSVIGDKDIESLRKDLGLEKEKIVKNRNGTIHQDNRDMEKIGKLEVEINNLEKAVQELARIREMEKGITLYMQFVDKPPKEVMGELRGVASL